MFSFVYYYLYGVEDKQKELAREQILFLTERKVSLCEKNNLSAEERQKKIKKIDLTLDAIRYTHSIYDI